MPGGWGNLPAPALHHLPTLVPPSPSPPYVTQLLPPHQLPLLLPPSEAVSLVSDCCFCKYTSHPVERRVHAQRHQSWLQRAHLCWPISWVAGTYADAAGLALGRDAGPDAFEDGGSSSGGRHGGGRTREGGHEDWGKGIGEHPLLLDKTKY